MADTPLLIRAAELLEELAEDLEDSHTVDGVWKLDDQYDSSAAFEHAELVTVAQKLRAREASDISAAAAMCEALNSGDGSYRP